ncbi:hypothetical protein ACHAPO_000665 [Fusarium lateritium]
MGGSGSDSMPERLSTWLDVEREPSNSEALLEEVEEVVACKEKSKISGLLFRYTDGKQASVGRFRLDCVKASLPVAGTPWLYTGSRVSDGGESVLEAIRISNPGNEESLEWNKMPLEGILTWDALSGREEARQQVIRI